MPRDRGRPGRGPERGAGRAREAHDHDGIERTVGYPGIPGSNGDRQRSPIHFQVKRAGDEHVPAVATFEEEKGMRRDLERVRETAAGGMGGASVSASPVARAGTHHPSGPPRPRDAVPAVVTGNAAIPHHHPTRRRNPTPHDATPDSPSRATTDGVTEPRRPEPRAGAPVLAYLVTLRAPPPRPHLPLEAPLERALSARTQRGSSAQSPRLARLQYHPTGEPVPGSGGGPTLRTTVTTRPSGHAELLDG
jgi:hypothetical protein